MLSNNVLKLIEWLKRNSHKAKTCRGNPSGTIVDETNKPEIVN